MNRHITLAPAHLVDLRLRAMKAAGDGRRIHHPHRLKHDECFRARFEHTIAHGTRL